MCYKFYPRITYGQKKILIDLNEICVTLMDLSIQKKLRIDYLSSRNIRL